MGKKKRARRAVSLRPRFRVMCGAEIALGPGRADLLELIGQTGSLRAAAKRMGMSYMRAWKIVKSLNERFHPALVDVARGGPSGGGAKLTETGRKVVGGYRLMERQTQKAVGKTWNQLRRFLSC
jgi:molybdate transport system regulatory protein